MTTSDASAVAESNATMLFLRLYGLLQHRQQSSPDPERHSMIERLKPLRNKLVHGVSLDESDQSEIDSSITELMAYLRLMETSSLGTAQAQTNRLLSTPADIDDVLQRSPIEPPRPQTATPFELLEARVTDAISGDRQAVSGVLEMIRPLVVRYCRARIGRAPGKSPLRVADDVAQEACLAVLIALPAYRDQGRPFMAFVYGITAHKVADALRAMDHDPLPWSHDDGRSDDEQLTVEEKALQGHLTERVSRLLDTLPDRQREIVILRIVVGLSAEETAEVVGSTPGAVRVAQHRALGRLRRTLAAEEVV